MLHLSQTSALCTSFVILAASTTALAQQGPYGTAWSGRGPGTITVTDGSTDDPSLAYELVSELSWDLQVWELEHTATDDGLVIINYNYSGFHGWYQVEVFLEAFIVSVDGTEEVFPLYSAGPVNCCESPSGGFETDGVIELPLQAGDIYGFRLGGEHFTANPTLRGTLSLN